MDMTKNRTIIESWLHTNIFFYFSCVSLAYKLVVVLPCIVAPLNETRETWRGGWHHVLDLFFQVELPSTTTTTSPIGGVRSVLMVVLRPNAKQVKSLLQTVFY